MGSRVIRVRFELIDRQICDLVTRLRSANELRVDSWWDPHLVCPIENFDQTKLCVLGRTLSSSQTDEKKEPSYLRARIDTSFLASICNLLFFMMNSYSL